MEQFQVSDYALRTTLERAGSEPSCERVIELVGGAGSGGGRSFAALTFSAYYGPSWQSPFVGQLSRLPDGVKIEAWLDLDEFETYLAVLASRQAVYLAYDLKEPGATQGYLSKIGLCNVLETSDNTRQVTFPANGANMRMARP